MSIAFKIEDSVITEMYGFYTPHYNVGDYFPPSRNNQNKVQFLIIGKADKPISNHVRWYVDEHTYQRRIKTLPAIHNPIEGQVLFRQHRGGLKQAMDTVVEVKNIQELTELAKSITSDFMLGDYPLVIEKYGAEVDKRTNWDTHIVMWGNTVIGFLSGPLDN